MSYVLRCIVGGIFVFAGTSKVFPFTASMAKDTLTQFTEFATVYPTVPLGYQPDPQFYITSLGFLEVLFGAGLLFAPGVWKKASCAGLMFLMAGGIQTLLCLKQVGMAVVPAAFFSILCYIWTTLNPDQDTKKQR